jgi:hypothetical protein
MSAGVGRPALVKMLLPTNKVPFPRVLDAVRSNSTAQGGDGSITLILERCDGAAADSSSSGREANVLGDVAAVDAGDADGAAFDPKIFE